VQRLWPIEELEERWTLGAEDLAWLSGLPDAGKLGLAAARSRSGRGGLILYEILGHFAQLRGHWACPQYGSRVRQVEGLLQARAAAALGRACLCRAALNQRQREVTRLA
jgi:hypothetical protein